MYRRIYILLLVGSGWLTSFGQDVVPGDTAKTDSVKPYSPTFSSSFNPTYRFGDPFSNRTSGSAFHLLDPSNLDLQIDYDSGFQYTIYERIGNLNFRPITTMSFREYDRYNDAQLTHDYWKEKSIGLDGESAITGRRLIPKLFLSPAFDRIFGGSYVDITPTGFINLDFGGTWQNIKNPNIPIRQRRNGGFNFEQQISMNLVGKIGDKLEITANFDNNNTFDFQNNMHIEYTGYDEEIIKKIEIGNVSMPVANGLMTGSQTLFGLKTELQFGKMYFTGVASRQQGQVNSATLGGGQGIDDPNYGNSSEENEIRATSYDENKHFFLGHFFRDNYETWLSDPRNIVSGLNIVNIEVYVTNTNNDTETTRNTVGFMDLGEQSRLQDPSLLNPSGDIPTSNYSNGLYQNLINSGFRNSNQINNDLQSLGLNPATEYVVTGTARQLERGTEFTVHKELGYITLLTNLSDNQSLAVAYQYTWNGQGPFTVGELSSERRLKDDESIFLKLIRPNRIDPDLPTWDLMMKNIYNLRSSSIEQANFKLRIKYKDDASGIDNPSLHEGGPNVENEPLVKLLGLDQYNQNLDLQPDGLFDFIPGATINADQGYLIFPVLEPFGSKLESFFDPATQASLIDKYVFDELYSNTLAIARTISEKDKYRIAYAGAGRAGGSGSGGQSNVINLEGLQVTPGSVVVRMGNVILELGRHYTVDYNFGTVTITDQSLLNSGMPIRAESESANLFDFQTTWFYAARLDYRFNEDFNVGATVLRLNERRGGTSRFNIGNEPLKNTKYGFDISLTKESNFLTKMVDAIPLISTKEPSQITFAAEYAKFIPGTSNDVKGEPTSFIEDFETAASPEHLGNALGTWTLSATPETNNGLFFNPNTVIPGRDFNYKKAKVAWYVVDRLFYTTGGSDRPENLSSEELQNHYVRAVSPQEIFRQLDPGQITVNQPILDIAFFPNERGQQNYTTDLDANGNLNNPTESWGGITHGFENETNFNESNFQYIEFWMLDPFIDGERGRVLDGLINQNNTTGGELIFNLGSVSEDVTPDGVNFFENGLPEDGDPNESQINPDWGRTPSGQYLTGAFTSDGNQRANQDVGFDGLRNDQEVNFFSDYLNSLGPARSEVEQDVSADDFVHFLNSNLDNRDANIIERYKSFNGTDGNSPSNTDRSSTTFPDKEDINGDNTLSSFEEYFEYKIPLSKNGIQNQNFVVDQVVDDSGEATWYQFRIPLEKFTGEYGDPSFQNIQFMRMYLTGWQQPVVMRFAKFQLTRSTWRKHTTSLRDPALGEIPEPQLSGLEISVVNVEENSTGSPTQPPYVVPPGLDRDLDNSQVINTRENEQSLQICVEDLENGDARGAFKTLPIDLVNYDRLEMFLHAHSYKNSNIQDGDVNAFIRLSTDNTNHYYEIEVPLVITPQGLTNSGNIDRMIWPKENEISLEIDLLKAIKVDRDRASIDLSVPYIRPIPNTNYRVTVVGNPDISDIQSLMIGVRNPDKGSEDDGLNKSVCLWANELRAVGYDTQKGWAANASLQTKLADLGQIDLNTRYTSIGYGALNTTVEQRNRFESFAYQASARVNLEKFMYPKKTGLVVPMFANYEKEKITPQYDPLNQDILLDEALKLFVTDDEKEDYQSLVESQRVSRGINFSNVRKEKVKPDAKSRVYDVENLSFTYAYSDQTSSNHFTQSKFSKNVSGGVNYDYTPISVSWEPFSKGEAFSSPYLQLIKDINFSPLPSSFSASALLDRRFTRTQFFNDNLTTDGIDPNYERLFTFNRLYNFRWNFFKSLSFDYTARANAVIDEPDGIIDDDINTSAEREYIWNQIWKLGRMRSFDQNVNFTYKTPLDKLPFTNWLGADLKYSAGYNWTAGALNKTASAIDQTIQQDQESPFGNIIQNNRDRGVIGKIDMVKLYDKVTFLNKANASTADDRSGTQRGLRTLMLLKSINVTYNIRETTSLTGFTPKAFLFGLDSEFNAPGVGFLFGNQNPNVRFRAAENGWLTTNPLLTAPFLQSKGTDFGVRGTFQPFEDLSIQIDFSKSNTNGYQEIFRYDTTRQEHVSLTPSLSGSYSISFLSIETAFEKSGNDNSSESFTRFEENINAMHNRLNDSNPSSTPYDSLSQDVIIPAFLSAYSGRGVNGYNLNPFPKIPLPNWRVDYTGLIKIPAVAEVFSSFTVSHGYNSTYTVGNFTNNLRYSDDLTLNHNSLNYPQATEIDTITNTLVPSYIINQVLISEQFVPLIGVNFRTKSNISTRIEYKKERNLSLNMSNAQVTETTNNDVILDFGLTKTGFKIPFRFRGRTSILPNDITFRVSFTVRDSETIQRKIEGESLITNGTFNYQVRPTVSYNINNQLDFTMYFERTVTEPKLLSSFRRATTAFGFQLRFNLAQ